MGPAFLLTSLIVVLAPGTGVLYTLAIGLSQGARASLAAAAGCTLGILPAMLAAILGLAALLQASAPAFGLFRILGALYLLWMARAVLRETGALQIASAGTRRRLPRVALAGFALNILNPKLAIFFLAFLPQFVPDGAPAPLARMLGLSAVFMAMTFAVFAGYGALAAQVRRHVAARPAIMAWLRRGFAAAFVLLAARLALATA
ncbi:LysE family translocator [Poseidonocella sp. HB161398]|uniref:LysE family translocator n=1 Tax=Poseidonocella sp. HB161398 TaxID=2320855 RepID=UPI001109464B|nr:LysE family translocator [Poseidonocella sp. HB161398]